MFVVLDKFEILNVYLFCFESDWRFRSEKLQEAKGFVHFELMRGKCSDVFTIYHCQTKWVSKEYFLNWLNSDNFLDVSRVLLGTPRSKLSFFLLNSEFNLR